MKRALAIGGGILAVLWIVGSLARQSQGPPAPAATSQTGVFVGSECGQQEIDRVDKLNQPNYRARIAAAYCYGGRVVKLRLKAQDGREMSWEPSEGGDALLARLVRGR